MSETGIRWATHTLNSYDWHCNKVSEGCKFCYAESLAKQYGKTFEGAPQWRGENTYKELKKIPAGSVVFQNSMSDTYHEGATLKMIHGVHAIALLRPDVMFLVLTKRIERALALAPYLAWPQNLWIGTSIEKEEYLWRLDYLLQIPAVGHFVSLEPCLGRISNLGKYFIPGIVKGGKMRQTLKWVIMGGESGPHRRRFEKAWAAEIQVTCAAAKVPFMFKQGSSMRPDSDRLLNGRTYDEYPFEAFRAAHVQPERVNYTERKPFSRNPREQRKHDDALDKLKAWNAAVRGDKATIDKS